MSLPQRKGNALETHLRILASSRQTVHEKTDTAEGTQNKASPIYSLILNSEL